MSESVDEFINANINQLEETFDPFQAATNLVNQPIDPKQYLTAVLNSVPPQTNNPQENIQDLYMDVAQNTNRQELDKYISKGTRYLVVIFLIYISLVSFDDVKDILKVLVKIVLSPLRLFIFLVKKLFTSKKELSASDKIVEKEAIKYLKGEKSKFTPRQKVAFNDDNLAQSFKDIFASFLKIQSFVFTTFFIFVILILSTFIFLIYKFKSLYGFVETQVLNGQIKNQKFSNQDLKKMVDKKFEQKNYNFEQDNRYTPPQNIKKMPGLGSPKFKPPSSELAEKSSGPPPPPPPPSNEFNAQFVALGGEEFLNELRETVARIKAEKEANEQKDEYENIINEKAENVINENEQTL